MLELDPSKRITADEALKHKYFNEEPIMCEPRDLPRIEKDSHEFQSRMDRAQNRQQGKVVQNAPNNDMMISKGNYNNQNPNYYNKNQNEAKIKIEENKTSSNVNLGNNINTEGPAQGNFNFSISSNLKALVTTTTATTSNTGEVNNTMLHNKRQMESTLEEENSISYKKQRFSPTNEN